MFVLQAEVFPYPEIGNEEVEEIKQLVAPVERFFSEEGEGGLLMNMSFRNEYILVAICRIH